MKIESKEGAHRSILLHYQYKGYAHLLLQKHVEDFFDALL